MEKMNKVLDSFMNEENNNFNEFFHYKSKEILEKREDYLEIKKEKNKIYEKYPQLQEFIEDEIPMNFDEKTTEAFYDLIRLHGRIHILELREAFKMGAKEAYIFFEEQNMLNI